MSIIAERVAKGVALLDKEMPDWRYRVDVKRLDISDCWNCVLGQLYGSFTTGKANLGLIDRDVELHGFDVVDKEEPNPDDDYNYYELELAWSEYIDPDDNAQMRGEY